MFKKIPLVLPVLVAGTLAAPGVSSAQQAPCPVGVINESAANVSTATTAVGVEVPISGLSVQINAVANCRYRITVSLRMGATGGAATGDVRVYRDEDYTGGSSTYRPLAGGAGAESVLVLHDDEPPLSTVVMYQARLVKTAGATGTGLVTSQTNGGLQKIIVEGVPDLQG